MMSAVEYVGELLAKLTAKGVVIGRLPGGTVRIGWDDVAAACAGVSRLGYMALRAKYCNDVVMAVATASAVRDQLLSCPDLAERLTRQEAFRVAGLVLAQYVSGQRCGRCQGRGTIYPKGRAAHVCQRCGGLGIRPATESERARSCGLDDTLWRRHVRQRADVALDELLRLEYETCGLIRRRLGKLALAA